MGTEKTCAGRSNGAALFGPKHDPYIIGLMTDTAGHIDRDTGDIFFGKAAVSSMPDKVLPYVQVSTATIAVQQARMAEGEHAFDVIDEHCTTMWFSSRAGYIEAFRYARGILNGAKFYGVIPGYDYEFGNIILSASIHHIVAQTAPSDEPVKVAATDTTEPDAAVLPVRLVSDGATSRADEGIMRFRLEHGFYLLIKTGTAKVMQWLTRRFCRIEGVNHGALFGLGESVTLRLQIKVATLLLFITKRQKLLVERQIGLLYGDDFLAKLTQTLAQRSLLGVLRGKHASGVDDRISERFEGVDYGIGQTNEGRNVL